MKRFLVFAGDDYYPTGGWDDFVGDCDTLAEATALVEKRHRDWAHCADLEGGPVRYYRHDKGCWEPPSDVEVSIKQCLA